MSYRNCGRSGLILPALSLGLWQGFGSYTPEAVSREIIHTAFDHGINHFDLANNYGSPAGASETLFGKIVRELPRDEVLITSKAGFRMWPGPFGDGGSRKSMIASCDQSLKRLGVDYLDIFYSHRPDDRTPIEETLDALETIVRQGKALYIGISNYADPTFTRMAQLARLRGQSPIIINQTFYSMLDRKSESQVLPTAAQEGIGVIAYSPLVQGLLTDRYLNGIPEDSRIKLNSGNGALHENWITPALRHVLQRLNDAALERGQSLAQMALAWLLKDPRLTSVLIGASKPAQVLNCLGCLKKLHFSAQELTDIEAILALPRT